MNIEALYTRYGPMVLRRCRQLLRNEDLALDAMQDTFVKIIDNKNNLKVKYPSSLLYTMATNHCLNIMAREKRSWGDQGILDQIIALDRVEEEAVNRLFLEQLFNRQKPSTKTIAVLHYLDGLTLEETGELSGLSVSGVRKRLRKLREAGLELENRQEDTAQGEGHEK